MKLDTIINKLNIEVLTNTDIEKLEINKGLVGDLLSYILSKGTEDTVWLTIQRHINIIAVASSVEIPAIIVCDDIRPDQKVIDAAIENEIVLMTTKYDAFTASGIIHKLFHESI